MRFKITFDTETRTFSVADKRTFWQKHKGKILAGVALAGLGGLAYANKEAIGDAITKFRYGGEKPKADTPTDSASASEPKEDASAKTKEQATGQTGGKGDKNMNIIMSNAPMPVAVEDEAVANYVWPVPQTGEVEGRYFDVLSTCGNQLPKGTSAEAKYAIALMRRCKLGNGAAKELCEYLSDHSFNRQDGDLLKSKLSNLLYFLETTKELETANARTFHREVKFPFEAGLAWIRKCKVRTDG